MGVACGRGYTLIRLQALRAGPVSAPIPNAIASSHPLPIMTYEPLTMNSSKFRTFAEKFKINA